MLENEIEGIKKYIREGKIRKAEISFQKLLREYPESLPLNLSYADFLLGIGEFSVALTVLKKGLKIAPENLDLRYLLGVTQQKLGRFHLAEREFEFVKKQRPSDIEIKRQLGWTKVMKGEIAEGRKLLREAISADLMNPFPYADLGTSYIMTLDFEEGFRFLETAKSLSQKEPFVLDRIEHAKKMEKDFEKFSEKDKKEMKEMRNDPRELKLAAIENMFSINSTMPSSKEEMEDVKKELELAGVNPRFSEIQAPKTKGEGVVVEYLKYHQVVKDPERKIGKEEFEELKQKLLNKKTTRENIKKALIILAHQGTREAIKLLENYESKAKGNLKDFAKLALEECKIFSKAKPGQAVRIIHS